MSAITICKFYTNPNPSSDNKNEVISRTLQKISVIDRRWKPDCGKRLPTDGEFWKVKIVHEFGRAMKGCFLVHPLHKVYDNEFRTLIPGTYDIESEEGLVVITPHNPGYWILPIEHRLILLKRYDAYAVIVDLQQFEGDISSIPTCK